MSDRYDRFILPDSCDSVDQDQEYVVALCNGREETVYLHDYRRFYQIEGLYEDVIYNRLKCVSPDVLADMLISGLQKAHENPQDLRILDFGAGNGCAARIIKAKTGCELIVGLDVIPEAKIAADRENPDVYDQYWVMGFENPSMDQVRQLSDLKFNCVFTVGALGFNDIQLQAFVNVFNLVEPQAWIAFNIRDRFITDQDQDGFARLLSVLKTDHLENPDIRKYCHRYSIAGNPLYYYAVVGKKNQNIDMDSVF